MNFDPRIRLTLWTLTCLHSCLSAFTQDCGRSTKSHFSKRIVGGTKSGDCEFPWVVVLNVGGAQCGGSIIDERHVLTAAHCLDGVPQNAQVLVGAGSNNVEKLERFHAQSWRIHPLRDPQESVDYDVAVITLNETIQYGSCLAPICLPTLEYSPPENDECWTAGWGSNENKQSSFYQKKASLPLVSNSKCKTVYQNGMIDDSKICAGDFEHGGKDACQGDSGGPLMCASSEEEDDVYVGYGIVSFGTGCAQPKKPGVYTRVNHPRIMDFILEALEDV